MLQEEIELMLYRSGCFDFGRTGTKICMHHKIYFFQKFQTGKKTCCDAFLTHRTKVKSWRHLLTLEDVKTYLLLNWFPTRNAVSIVMRDLSRKSEMI